MNKETMLMEIRRAAAENGNGPLGIARFEELTGITGSAWRGRFWTTWGEATAEAGIQAGRMNEAFESDHLLTLLAELSRKCGRFPTDAETKMARARDKNFPDAKVYRRFGAKAARIESLRKFVSGHPEFSDVAKLLPESAIETDEAAKDTVEPAGDGYVYLLKHGNRKEYKIGFSNDPLRRYREIKLQLPEELKQVHEIRTDDPSGIEAYWHKRFENKHTNGEWYALDLQDVKAFKRRKFM